MVPPPISSRQQPSSRSSCVRHGFGGGQRLERGVADHDAGAIDGGDDILRRGDGGGDDMHVDFELLADHADGIANAVLRVDQKFLREHVQDFAIFGKGDGARGIHGAAHVFALDIARRDGRARCRRGC